MVDTSKELDSRLLIIDDDSDVRDLICTKLESEGYSCKATSNAESALTMAQKEHFDLVICDVILPGIDGITLTEVVKAKYPTIGVIAITGRADVESAVRAMKAGADDYITKPFNLDHIVISVERTLEKQRLIQENRNYQQFLEQRVQEATQKQQKALEQLRQTKDYLENLIESSADAIMSLNVDGTIQFCNQYTENLFGQPVSDLRGRMLADFCVGGKTVADRLIATVLAQGRVQNYEVLFSPSEEGEITTSVSGSVLENSEGERIGIIAILKDISEQKKLENELQELSIKDNLTSLFNQRHFYRVLQREMNRAGRQNHPLCLLLLDLDNFKQLNDTKGHLAGDRILERVGLLIKDCTREHVDYTFRYGGDEFTIILSETTPEQAQEVAERVKESMPKSLPEENLTLSIGLAEFTTSQSLEEFINRADKAMYEAKKAGGNRIAIDTVSKTPIES